MTLPGADTIKAGIIGDDCFLCIAVLFLFFKVPLILRFASSSGDPLMDPTIAGIEGDVAGLSVESDGVSSCAEVVVLELERRDWETCLVLSGFPDHLVERLVILLQ